MSVVAGQPEQATNIRQHFIGNGMGYSDRVCAREHILFRAGGEGGVGWVVIYEGG